MKSSVVPLFIRLAALSCGACLHNPGATAPSTAPSALALACPNGEVTRTRTLLGGEFVAVEYKPRTENGAPAAWLRLYDGATGALLGEHPVADGGGSFAMLPDRTLLVSDGDQVRAVRDGVAVFSRPARELTAPFAPALRALPTGNWLASHDAGSVALLDGAGAVLMPNDPATRHWTVSDDGERLAVARWVPERQNMRLDLHDGRTGALLASRDAGPDESYERMVFSPDHRTLVVRQGSWSELGLLDGDTGAPEHHLGYEARAVSVPLGFTPAGELVVESGLGGLEIWDLSTGRLRQRVPWAHDAKVEPLPETCTFDEERFPCPAVEPYQVAYLSRVDPPWGAAVQVAVMHGEPGPPRPRGTASLAIHSGESAVITPDGARLIALMQSERHAEVQTWDLRSGELLRIVPVPMPMEFQANFKLSPDASVALLVTSWQASVTYDASVAPDKARWNQAGLVFDLATGQQIASIPSAYDVVGLRRDGGVLTLTCP